MKFTQVLLIIFISSIVFHVSNTSFLNGSIRSHQSLKGELDTDIDSLYEWNLSQQAPFKYRVLFPAVVKSTYQLLTTEEDNALFFKVYKGWSWFFFVSASVLFFYFLRVLKFSNQIAYWGLFLFLLSPPVLMAFTVPVHTREDFLGYSILLTGLIAIMKKNQGLILASFIAGAFCRETLLILPFVYLFFSKDQGLPIRLIYISIPFIILILIRVFMGLESYSPYEGLLWNLNNIEQVIGFSLIAYGFMWVILFIFLTRMWVPTSEISEEQSLICRSAGVVLALIIGASMFGGRMSEMRLLFLSFPWVLTLVLVFFEERAKVILQVITHSWFILFALLSGVASFFGTVYLLNNYLEVFGGSKFNIPFSLWIITGMVIVYIFTISLPLVYISIKKQNS